MFPHIHRRYLCTFIRSHFVSSLTRARSKPPIDWRSQIKQSQHVSQISTVLLQRNDWPRLLRSLDLSSELTPSVLLQVLHSIRAHPQISLEFFNWAKSTLGFQPDVSTHCKVAQILVSSGQLKLADPIVNSLIHAHPSSQVFDSLIESCKGTDLDYSLVSCLVDCYCKNGMYSEALEVYLKSKRRGCFFSIHIYNALLDVFQQRDEIGLCWCLYAVILRNNVEEDQLTWTIIARILYKSRKFERIGLILNAGICNSVAFDLIVDGYGERGDFTAAFYYLDGMCKRKFDPSFCTYSSILDGACKHRDTKVIEIVMATMVEKGYLPKPKEMVSQYDSIIQKFAQLGKLYAADMFFNRASDEKIELQSASYGCMLREFSKEGRVKEAMEIYRLKTQKKIVVSDRAYIEFVNALCKEAPREEVSELLKDIIVKGFSPCESELSSFMTSQCKRRRWKEVEELLTLLLDRELLPGCISCCALIEHYCFIRQIDSALGLHDKIEILGGSLDVKTYGVLLNGLFKEGRVEAAMRMFDYMRRKDKLSGTSFAIMISGLCKGKEFRRAMKLHDEMLKLGLKPDKKTYKRLISCFR